MARTQPRIEPPRSEARPAPPLPDSAPQQPQVQARAEPRPAPPTARPPEARAQPKVEPTVESTTAPTVPSAPGAPAVPGPVRPQAGPSINEPVAVAPLPEAPKRKKTDDNEVLSRFALEVARLLGKEMRADTEYPARARAEGAGGTAQMQLRFGADGKLTDVSVTTSSGHEDLDQYASEKISKLRLPRVPAEFRSRAFSVQIPVTFAVRKR